MSETLSPPFRLECGNFFRDFAPQLRGTIRGLSETRHYLARQFIYSQGDPATSVFWVLSGRVKVSHLSGDGREVTLRHLREGEMFGEECVEPAETRCNHAESLEETLVAQMGAEEFRELLARDGAFALAVARQSLNRIRAMESKFSETVFRPVRRRIAAGLLDLYHQGDPGEKTIRITHQEVANLVGSTRETTTSVLHTFREAGVLEIANRRVTVLDPDALRDFAQQA